MGRKNAAPKRGNSAAVSAGAAPDSFSAKRLELGIVLLLVTAGVVAYANSFRVPFVFDDRYHIVESARIRQLWPPWPILMHSSRPVLHLSLAVNYALGGLDPVGYHLFNLAFHILAGMVLFGILRRSLAAIGVKPPNTATWLAGLIALIWLVHPIQTEAVTYTIQRSESLMGLFYLLTLYCVIRMVDSARSVWWAAGAVASLFCGVGSKGGVILTAPVVIALYDRFFLARSWRGVVGERWGLYAAMVATCGTYWFMMASAPEEWKESVGLGYGVTPMQYLLAQPGVILHYLRLTFLPEGFCLDYGWPLATSAVDIAAPLLVIATMILGTLWAWRRKPEVAFLGCWFFLILGPSSSIIPIADVMVEHRMYLSLAAVVTAAVMGLYAVGRGMSSTVRWAAAVAVVLLLMGLTIRRNQDYESKVSIWADAVRKSPGNPRAQYDLAAALEEVKQYPAAIEHYRAAVEVNPKYADALNNLGHALVVIGKPEEAMPHLRRALELKPDLAVAHNSLGVADAQQGKSAEAIAELREAVRLKPDYAEAHNNLGIALAQQKRTLEAIAEWESALRIDPNLADAHNNVAYALAELGRNREAMTHYERALAINPNYYQAAISYARLLAAADSKDGGDLGHAASVGQRACDITGRRDLDCLRTLAAIYAQAHRGPDAVKTAQAAVELAVSAGRQDLAGELRGRLEQYRNLR